MTTGKHFLIAFIASSAVLGCNSPGDDEAGPNQPSNPHVIIVSVDTLRADHMSLYGHQRQTTPFLEELAREAATFDRFFYSGGGTLPSHMTMMTSLNPHTHRLSPENAKRLEDERETLAEHLQRQGYQTAAFVDGGWVSAKFGFDQGFDLYDDEGGRLAKILPKAYSWLEEHHAAPFFLFLHTYDVHSQTERLPYDCPGDYPFLYTAQIDTDFDPCREGVGCATKLLAWANQRVQSGESQIQEIFSETDLQYIEALYDGCINYVDDQIRILVNHLKKLGVFDNSIFVVTSDHGEEFGEHGMLIHHQGGYEELSHIPLMIRFPRGEHAGTRVHHLAAMVDLMPTILDSLDIEMTGDAQGRSLMPAVIENRAVRESLHMYAVLRTDQWKYFSKPQELYHLPRDPAERDNIAASRQDVALELESEVRALVRQDAVAFEEFQKRLTSAPSEVELTPEEIERLKALGYLQ